jgi:hypothetical protein
LNSGDETWIRPKRITPLLGDISEKLPPREWELGYLALRGEMTLVGSPGNVGKSTFTIGLLLEVASGKEFLGDHVWKGAQGVLFISKEDDRRELKRGLLAAVRHHKLTQEDYNRIDIHGIENTPNFMFTTMKDGKEVIDSNMLLGLELRIVASGASIVVIDPLINFISGGLNDNPLMGDLMTRIKVIAIKLQIAIFILHHTAKGKDLESPEAFMGAYTIRNECRIALTLIPMTGEEAGQYNIAAKEAHRYFRLFWNKYNKTDLEVEERWYRKHSLRLCNARGVYTEGDSIGVVERVNLNTLQQQATSKPRNAIFDLITLHTIAARNGNDLLSMHKQSGSDRYIYDQLRRAMRGVAELPSKPKERKALLEDTVNDLLDKKLIEVQKFTDLGGRPKTGINITELGMDRMKELEKVLNW